MKEEEPYKDDELRTLFQSLDDLNAPYGLDDRIMKLIKADVQRSRSVRRNLRRALAGVAATLALIAWFAASGNVPSTAANLIFPGLENYVPGMFMLVLSVFGLLFLFLELEFGVKFWLRKKKSEKEEGLSH
ncbi:MAG: hypothetical protein H6563_14280 [Lewinellaceae bacterium]|nr:hypothetical protein [Lewinellaceae bacterium]